MIRLLKAELVFFGGLLCLFYAANNIANLQEAYGFVAYVLSMAGHEAYPNAFGPGITNSILVWLVLIIILVGEFAAGFLCLKGSWDLFRARKGSADDFNGAKTHAVLGLGIGVVVWFGLFMGIAGAYFQMWQTEAGTNAHNGAFQYAMALGMVMIFVNMKDD